MNSKKIQTFLTIGLLFGLAFLGMLEPAMAARNPKIHVLFVWGTKATDTRQNCLQTRENFEKCMADIGIRSGGKYIASFTSLAGDDAHPETILRHCNRMAQQAGSDDAIFVYILCHGCSTHLDGVPKTKQNLIHALSPVASDAEHMNLREIGIKRSSIIRAMKGGNHRLTVLITDACSGYNENRAGGHDFIPSSFSQLMYVLLNSTGTINWNSTDPEGGNLGQGELALGKENGTIFTFAFLKVACKNVSKGITANDFFNQLGGALVDSFEKTKRELFSMPGAEAFSDQKQQTLTQFDDEGHATKRWQESYRVKY